MSFGRFENPFFSTEIIWDDDIGFDGVAVQLSAPVSNQTTAFLTAGAFPIFNNSLNIPMGQRSDSASNFKSENRYLFAVQGGIEQKITKNIEAKFAVGYYYFQNVQGSLSAPYAPESDSDAGSTDGLRPTFAQKGNTYMGLRNLQNSPVWNNNGQENMWQYYGLATPFRVLSATAKVDFNHFEPFQISLFGEFVNNFGVSASDIENIGIGGAVNNRNGYIDPVTNDLVLTNYNGGGMGWIVGVSIGDAVLDERWKWRAGVDYRYMESDSFIDGFVGSDFGMGGTNLKGVTVGGRMALFKSVSLGARWMSASEVSGEAYRADIFQLDLTARF